MKKRIGVLLLLVILVSAMGFPLTTDADEVKYPTEINGYPVIFVQTHENTCTLTDGEIVLTILDTKNTAQTSLSNIALGQYMKENTLPKGCMIEVYGGPGVSKESFVKIHNQNNAVFLSISKESPKWFSGRVPYKQVSNANVKQASMSVLASYSTFAACDNLDPSNQTITDQQIQFTAPTVGSNQDWASFLMNNGRTNGNYFLQTGQMYVQGAGYHIWADTGSGLSPNYFNLSYTAGYSYEYSICYDIPGEWSLWCENLSFGTFDYVLRTGITGTYLASDTSVFFENWNSNANWYQGFSNHLYAYQAKDYIVQWKYWQTGQIQIINSAHQLVPNNGIITGGLLNGSQACWHVENIVVAQ
jgi:hypothetical protein